MEETIISTIKVRVISCEHQESIINSVQYLVQVNGDDFNLNKMIGPNCVARTGAWIYVKSKKGAIPTGVTDLRVTKKGNSECYSYLSVEELSDEELDIFLPKWKKEQGIQKNDNECAPRSHSYCYSKHLKGLYCELCENTIFVGRVSEEK